MAPPLSLDHIDVASLSPSFDDAGDVRSTDLEFDPSSRPLDRSLMAMPAPLGALYDVEPGAVPLGAALAAAPPTARPDHSLTGLAVVDLPFYLRLEALTSANVGPSSAAADHAAAAAVTEGLAAQGVDFEVQADVAEWRCALTSPRGSRCAFTVRLWRSGGKTLVLESQGLSGDAHTFVQAHRSLVARVTGAAPPPRPAATPSLPRLEPSEDALALYVVSCKASVASGCLDAALEGVRVLAALSADAELRGTLHRCEVVPALVELVKSQPSLLLDLGRDCELLAVACLANLAQEPICQRALLDADCVPLLLDLVRDGNYEDRSMRRHAARALRALAADAAGADSIIRQVGKARLAAWAETTYGGLLDERMAADVSAVKDRIEERWVAVST